MNIRVCVLFLYGTKARGNALSRVANEQCWRRDNKQRCRKAGKDIECKTSSEVAEEQFCLRVCKYARAEIMAEVIWGAREGVTRAATWLKPHAMSPSTHLEWQGCRLRCRKTDMPKIRHDLIMGHFQFQLCGWSERKGWPAGLCRFYKERNKVFWRALSCSGLEAKATTRPQAIGQRYTQQLAGESTCTHWAVLPNNLYSQRKTNFSFSILKSQNIFFL